MAENNRQILYLKANILLYLSRSRIDHFMNRLTALFFIYLLPLFVLGQSNIVNEIKRIQLDHFKDGDCLDFIRAGDLPEGEIEGLQQIIIVRHGEPAMNKKGWKNRKEAIRYTEMYDSVGVYDFSEPPVCFRKEDIKVVYTSKLPRAINTAEKTFGDTYPRESLLLFNEFERKVIKFPNIKLPRQFWSITTRLVWILGGNHKGIETFSQAKDRSKRAAFFLDDKAANNGKAILFSHGFLNKYIKRYLKNLGYKALNLDGQKYLGAYYFYKIN